MEKIKRHRIDQLGIITSGLCAIHCAAIPILLSLGVIGGLTSYAHETLEIFIITTSAILGVWSVYNALSSKAKLLPQFLIGFGALMIVLGLISIINSHIVMAIGGCMLLLGHWLNWRHMPAKI